MATSYIPDKCAAGYKRYEKYGRRQCDLYWGWGVICRVPNDEGIGWRQAFLPDTLRCENCPVECYRNTRQEVRNNEQE